MENEVIIILKIFEKYGGIANFSEIIDAYQKYVKVTLSPAQRMRIKSIMKHYSSSSQFYKGGDDLFCLHDPDKDVWALNKYVFEPEPVETKKKDKRTRTPEQKLLKRIKREIKKVKYIGDIAINSEEYDILIDLLRLKINSFNATSVANKGDAVLAVALVQIGIKEYDGNYWSHVSEITGTKIDGQKQRMIGEKFFETLLVLDKIHGEKNEHVNNILMHCFITEHYAMDFFDFLYLYYQIDLERDLDKHTKEMRDYLMHSMSKSESSARAYKIKKGTSDAVTANELGCKIRVRRILQWIDNYFFDNVLPVDSNNRVAKMFVDWAQNSKSFNIDKSGIQRIGIRGKKRYKSPYLHIDSEGNFEVVLPIQLVHLSDDELKPNLSWKATWEGNEVTIACDSTETITGCKTSEIKKIQIKPSDIFKSFKFELYKNDEVVNVFKILTDEIRCFDEDYDFISSTNHLPTGTIYLFTPTNDKIETNCDFIKEFYSGLCMYNFNLETGDIIKKPSGKVLVVGDQIVEGIVKNGTFISNVFVRENDVIYDLYKEVPNLLFKTKVTAENGILISINGEKKRFNKDDCIVFKQDNDVQTYYLLNLESYCQGSTIYDVIIDIPNDKKNRSYKFAVISDFKYQFVGAPYIFKSNGKLCFSCSDTHKEIPFSIGADDIICISYKNIDLLFEIPVLRWKFDIEDEWHIEKPSELWHKELSSKWQFKYPSSDLMVYSKETDMDSDNPLSITIRKLNVSNLFDCDTIKIKSWLDIGPSIHKIYLKTDDFDVHFIDIITSCLLTNCELKNNPKENELIIKSNILGYSDCAVDVFCDGNLIAEKAELKYNGVKIKTDKLYGKFRIVFFEYDDEEDDFGIPAYSDFDKKQFELINKNNLQGKSIRVHKIIDGENNASSIFAPTSYDIQSQFMIRNLVEQEPGVYEGVSSSVDRSLNGLKVCVELPERDNDRKAIITFYSEEEETFVDFLYDKRKKALITTEDETLSVYEKKQRYPYLSINSYYSISVE